MSYQYNANGQRTHGGATIDDVADYVLDYSYDALGRVTSLQQHGVTGGNAVAEKRIDFSYDAAGRYDTIEYFRDVDGGPSNLVMTADYTLDAVGQLTGLVYTDAHSDPLRSFGWIYDAAGRITSHDSNLPVEDVTAYTYDATNQLQGVDYAVNYDESYRYDLTGNRTSANDDTYATGEANQTTSDGTYAYSYDAEGNRVARYMDIDESGTLNTGDSLVTQYIWDHRNRLARVEYRAAGGALTQAVDYLYDADNRRIGSLYDTNGDGTVDRAERYVWDGTNVVYDFVDPDGDGGSAPLSLATRYLWGQSVDQLLAQEDVDDGGNEDVQYPIRDNLGSTRSLVDCDGDITATYRYSAYGNLTVLAGVLSSTRFLYTCQEYDSLTGNYYYNARWYDPATGKFLSEDPIGFEGGDTHLYRYVRNSPVEARDPSGLMPFPFPGSGDFTPPDQPASTVPRTAWIARLRAAKDVHNKYVYYTGFGMSNLYNKLIVAATNLEWDVKLVPSTGDAAALYLPYWNELHVPQAVATVPFELVVHESVHIYNDYHYRWPSRDWEESRAYAATVIVGLNTMLPLQTFEDRIRSNEPQGALLGRWRSLWLDPNAGMPKRVIPPVVESRPGLITDVIAGEEEFGYDFSCAKYRKALEYLWTSHGYTSQCLVCPPYLAPWAA